MWITKWRDPIRKSHLLYVSNYDYILGKQNKRKQNNDNVDDDNDNNNNNNNNTNNNNNNKTPSETVKRPVAISV